VTREIIPKEFRLRLLKLLLFTPTTKPLQLYKASFQTFLPFARRW